MARAGISSGMTVMLVMLGVFCIPRVCPARILLAGERLELTGYVKEQILLRSHIPRNEKRFHDSAIDMAYTGMLAEGLLHLKKDGSTKVHFFAGLRFWYDAAPRFDESLRRSIPHRARKNYSIARDDEYLNEAYLDITAPRWQLRIGKQIVVWGETDIIRTADVINPLDARYSLPGIDQWEEIKRGLWMVRWIAATGLPGDVLFELLFIPGDFQYMRLPLEGTHWGVSPARTSLHPGHVYGYGHWLGEKMRRDAPGWNLRKQYEWGVRLRGYTFNIDWTLFYFDTVSDTAVMNPKRALRFAADYVVPVLGGALRGVSAQPRIPSYKVFDYKRYRVVGGTLQTHFEQFTDAVWRLEWFYERGQAYNRAPGGRLGYPAYDSVRRDSFGMGMTYSDRFAIPYVTHAWCSDKQLEVGLTVYYEKIFDYDRDLVVDAVRGHRRGSSHSSALIWNVVQPLHHQTWVVVFAGSLYESGMYFVLPMVSYIPGNHWRWDFGAALFGDRSSRARHPYHDKDSIIFRVWYEW